MPVPMSLLSIQLYDCPRCKAPRGSLCLMPSGRKKDDLPAHTERMNLLTPRELEQCRLQLSTIADLLRDNE